MSLRARFTLWFALAALLPIGAAAFGTRAVLSRIYREGFDESRQEVEQQLQKILRSQRDSVKSRVEALCDRDNPFIGGLLQELRTTGELSRVRLQLLRQKDAPAVMRLSNLDMLYVLDSKQTVLLAPHFRADQDKQVEMAQALLTPGSEASYEMQNFMIDGSVQNSVVVQAGCQLGVEGYRFFVRGGVKVRESEFSPIRKKGSVSYRLVDGKGEVLVEPLQKWESFSSNVLVADLNDEDGSKIAALEVGFSDKSLAAILSRLTILSLFLSGVALFLMVIVGWLVARRITGHLDDLVLGANAVAEGDLAHRVPIRTKDEIGKVASALNLMVDELSVSKERLVMAERIAAWQEIARRIAHEIKNPLTPIQMSIETLRKIKVRKPEAFEEAFQESTDTVLEETARLKRIVSEFSEFARMPPLEKASCDINDILNKAVNLYSGSVQIQTSFGEIPDIMADRDKISQSFVNLIENARAAVSGASEDDLGSAEPLVFISTEWRAEKNNVVIRIEDAGAGISPDIKDKLFTPYFTTKHTQGGTGLGLAIVHRIIAEHGGRISATNRDIGGACFTIVLPAAR